MRLSETMPFVNPLAFQFFVLPTWFLNRKDNSILFLQYILRTRLENDIIFTCVKENSLINFIFYLATSIAITGSLIIFLTLKNECREKEIEIIQLNKSIVYNTNIVKELQSRREYLLSESYISSALSNKMISVAPETLLIHINTNQ